MAQDLVGLYNLALSAIGTRARVSLPTEVSREAEICELWFPPVRDTILRAAHWQSAKRTAVLGLVAERDFSIAWAQGAPTPEWRYANALPNDFLYPWYISNFQQFEMGVTNGQRVLLSSVPNVVLAYTGKETSLELWDSDLYMAMVHGLASAIALPLHGKASRAKLSYEMANEMITRARVRAANESNQQFESIPDWLTVRGVSQPSAVQSYIYPFGPLLTFGTTTV